MIPLLLALLGCSRSAPEPPPPPPTPAPHTVVFVVLDTVRAQNLSLCGYDRPTSPFLESLRDKGASWSCQAYAPGAWTAASHASYFTGLTVPQTGVVKAGIPLGDTPETLAEALAARGYKTVMVSANRVLSRESGLQRGFSEAITRHEGRPMLGNVLWRAVRKVLRRTDPDTPLFLFVNIFDAHDPFPEIPAGVGWVPEQARVHYHANRQEQPTNFHRYTRGEMDPAQQEAWLARVRDGYDYGISRADRVLKLVFTALENSGRFARSHRWLVTSDHGEFLGEHGNLRHGCFVFEEVTRVPLLFHDSRLEQPLALSAPVSAASAFHLVRDGALSADPLPPHAVSEYRSPARPSANMAGLWASTTDKIVVQDGAYLRFDLATDPGESAPLPLGDHPLRPALEALASEHAAAISAGRSPEPRYEKMLEELGYVQ